MADNVKIMGNTVGVPNPRSDWNQTDPTKADYIKNKPDLNQKADKKYVDSMDTELLEFINEKAEKTEVANLGEQISDKASTDYVDESVAGAYLDLDKKKVEKVAGKGLSTNDFTTALLTKLNGIPSDATSSPKVIRFQFENEYDEGVAAWSDKSIFHQFENGFYYITTEYPQIEFGGDFSDSVLLLCKAYEDGGWHVDRMLINMYGDIYSNHSLDGEESDWEIVSVTEGDVTKAINKAIGDVETSLENIIAKYGLGGDAQ